MLALDHVARRSRNDQSRTHAARVGHAAAIVFRQGEVVFLAAVNFLADHAEVVSLFDKILVVAQQRIMLPAARVRHVGRRRGLRAQFRDLRSGIIKSRRYVLGEVLFLRPSSRAARALRHGLKIVARTNCGASRLFKVIVWRSSVATRVDADRLVEWFVGR